jgi:hypothetical protein
VGSIKNGLHYFETASALFGSDAVVVKDSAVQAQLLMTQGLLFFVNEQVSATFNCSILFSKKCYFKTTYVCILGFSLNKH